MSYYSFISTPSPKQILIKAQLKNSKKNDFQIKNTLFFLFENHLQSDTIQLVIKEGGKLQLCPFSNLILIQYKLISLC